MTRRMTYQPRHALAPRARFEVHLIAGLAAVGGMLAIAFGAVLGMLIVGGMP